MKPQRTKGKTPPRKPNRRSTTRRTEPVEVCARLRNLTKKARGACAEVTDDTTIRLTGPAPDYRVTNCKFFRVFNEAVTQKLLFDSVVSPMVDDLVLGKNGLLFTYGVTGSGKTYTMSGNNEEPGFLPRTLDMIFNSIRDLQANKYVMFPDGMNGFVVQTEVDALQLRQENDLLPQLGSTKKSKKNKQHNQTQFTRCDIDYAKSQNARKDHRYAVFISYVEIYNNQVFDLLADVQMDTFNRPRAPQQLRLREDRTKNVFVYGSTQVEVRDTDEAFELLRQGNERKRVANTQLNAESSRSHSVMNIRLVRSPLDPMGEDLLQETSLIRVGQLSLVDLAGSERSNRTGVTSGGRLLEAGNINGSLMTLRRCLEQLRFNQRQPANAELVKYRNSKLTHLFKSYFEGRGKVKMVVCVNPNMDEYDENVHVMQFAETASQVEVVRSDDYHHLDQENLKRRLAAIKAEKARKEEERRQKLTAARQINSSINLNRNRLNSTQKIKKTQSRINPGEVSTSSSLASSTEDMDVSYEGPDYEVAEPLPCFKLLDWAEESCVEDLVSALNKRQRQFESVNKCYVEMSRCLRGNLAGKSSLDHERINEVNELKRKLSSKTKEAEKNERQIRKLESKNQVLTRTTQVFEKDKQTLQSQLNDAEAQVKSSQMEVRKLDRKYRGAVANTKAEARRECEMNVRNAQHELQEKMWLKDEKLRQLKNVVKPDMSKPTAKPRHQNFTPQPLHRSRLQNHQTPATAPKYRHRRSRSAENLLSTATETETDSTSSSTAPLVKKPAKKSIKFSASTSDMASLATANSTVAKNVAKIAEAEQNMVGVTHRRQRSRSNNGWLEHRPAETVTTGTIFQPNIRPDRVVNVPKPKDVAKSSNYLLTHQVEDDKGAVTTQLVKGEVYKTRTGGQQVQFVDIETLANKSPLADVNKPQQKLPMKRKSNDDEQDWTDVETRCAYGISNNPTCSQPATAKAKKSKK